VTSSPKPLTFQELILRLQTFWAERGCVLQQPYDVEVGAGTMAPETFLRVLGPKPYKVAYVQPSRRPADGRYGENPNRLFKHMQLQVILKPPPENVQELYLESLAAIGIDLRRHDIKFEEDNWEAPTLSAWGVGWQVMLDGLEITQFTYFQQCGGVDLFPISAELTYGLERIGAFLQDVDSIYDIVWARDPDTGSVVKYRDVRLADEKQFSVYNFEAADVESAWRHFELFEAECKSMIEIDFRCDIGENWIRWFWREFSVPLRGQYVRIPEGNVPMSEMFGGKPNTAYEFAAIVDEQSREVSIMPTNEFRPSPGKVVVTRKLQASTVGEGETEAGGARMSNPFALPLPALDLCLKCSHLFNILDARGAISVTERVGVIARVRALAVGIAKAWVDQQKNDQQNSEPSSDKADEREPVSAL
jgi:tetrameric-type glycyl-tRNA synthetase alpha subunit